MKIRLLIPLCLIGLMFACSPATKLEKSWIEPSLNAETMKPFTKVLIVAPIKDEASQRIAEDKIAAQLRPGVAVQSYTYPKMAQTDQQELQGKLITDKFDGLILMRLKEVEQSTSYTPGTSYGGWYGYRNYSPGYYTEDKTFMVETSFYSLPDNKLLWSGTTSSLNPTSYEKTLDQIIMAIKYELQKKGFVKK
ncbi:MAG: hypothetical protein AB9834_21380 [Lentimicrobium sp.]